MLSSSLSMSNQLWRGLENTIHSNIDEGLLSTCPEPHMTST